MNIRSLAGLPRTVWLLGVISLLNDSASEMVYPLLPLYLASVLLTGPRVLGVIEGAAEALGSVMKLVSGALSDRFSSQKLPVVLGYSIAALARPLLAFVSSAGGVFALRCFDKLGKALRSAPRDALLAGSVPEQQRGLAFGLHRSMDHCGAVIGPLLAFAFLAAGWSIQEILYWALLPGILCVLAAIALTDTPVAAKVATAPRFEWHWRALPLGYRRYLWVLALFALGNSSNMFLLLRAKEQGLSDTQVALCWAATSAIAMFASTPLSSWSDRIGRFKLIYWGWGLYALLYLGFGFNSDPRALWLLFPAYGLFMAATEGAEKALVADLVEPQMRGRAFGWFYLMSGLPLLPASMLFGWAMQHHSALAFAMAATCAVLAAALLAFYVQPLAQSNLLKT